MRGRGRPAHRGGAWHGLVGDLGPVQTVAVLTTATVGALAAGPATRRRRTTAQAVLMGVVAFDLAGGLVAFQLPPTRQRYRESTVRDRLLFTALHLHPFVVPLTGQGSWSRAATRYGAAVLAGGVLEALLPRSPRRRAVATTVATALSVLDRATDDSAPQWLGPVYLLKLIGGHGSIPRP